MSQSVNNPTQNKGAGALTGDEVVEVQRGQWAPKFKTSTQAIGNLGKGVTVTDNVHTVTNASTIITSGGTVAGSGGVATITGFGGGGGAPTVAAGSLFGNPGTVAAAGTNVAVGTGLTLTSGGTLNATGGGGGSYTAGNGIDLTGGTITNTGTLVQAAGTAGQDGVSLLVRGGPAGTDAKYGGHSYEYGGLNTNAGTIAGTSYGGYIFKAGGDMVITNPAGVGRGGDFVARGGKAIQGGTTAQPAALRMQGGHFNDGFPFVGGGWVASSGQGNPGGPMSFVSGDGVGSDANGGEFGVTVGAGTGAGKNGSFTITLQPTGSGGGANFRVLNLPTSDPGVGGAFYVDPVTHIVHWK